MREELVEFVLNEGISPFSSGKTLLKKDRKSVFMTKDARKIYSKVLGKVSGEFVFSESSNIWNCFGLDINIDEIRRRQEFFKTLVSKAGSRSSAGMASVNPQSVVGSGRFLKELSKPRASWKPKYDVVVVTEDEGSFIKLNELSCGVILLTNQNDVADLERYDVVQVVDCDDFVGVLERLPQSVFLDDVEDVYLERFLEELSGWRENFAILNGVEVSGDLRECLDDLIECFALLENKEGSIITEGEVERVLEEINEEVGENIKEMTISGSGLMKMLGEGKMPDSILEVIRDAIERSGIPEHIFNLGIPVSVDYKELQAQIKIQSANEFSDVAERIKRNASKLKKIPGLLKRLEAEILVEDFCNGVAEWMVDGGWSMVGEEDSGVRFPGVSKELLLEDCYNMFLKDAQPISFILNDEAKCSILTGANSGGKTTLLEHVLQNIGLFRMGLPVSGNNFKCPVFDAVYYFAKTKGSTSKGAFETLLTQMAQIGVSQSEEAGDRFALIGHDSTDPQVAGGTLILADEIEAVTEPGVAGKIIGASAEYFIKRGCFVILATHLGAEIAKSLPQGARVDGIEASGLDENFNLIVNHNPVLGRLASSTPELIVERMAGSLGGDYFNHLLGKIREKNSDN